jgi:hypothetical protein
MATNDYENGYEAGSKNGYRQGYKKGLEAGMKAGREEAIKAIAEVPGIPDATRLALYKMGKKAHPKQNNEPDNVRSVFAECPCLNCIDGGVDMPYCAECNRANGYTYFRKKVVVVDG